METLLFAILALLAVIILSNPMENPIANLHGLEFLLFYGIVIAVTLYVSWLSLRHKDSTANLPPLLIPTQPDSYQIAYLRGEENEVTLLIIFNLLQRGYLYIKSLFGGQEIAILPEHPDLLALEPIEHEVFNWFDTPQSASAIFNSKLPHNVNNYCSAYEQYLQYEQLLLPESVKALTARISALGITIIFGLGLYKLLVALAQGRSNVWFLIAMGILSLMILANLCSTSRLSQRGKTYLERLQQTFEQLKLDSLTVSTSEPNMMSLTVALFGVGMLAGTPYTEFEQMFRPSTTSDGGGDGGDGGGGCGGCGGCGGGCGG